MLVEVLVLMLDIILTILILVIRECVIYILYLRQVLIPGSCRLVKTLLNQVGGRCIVLVLLGAILF